MCAQSRLYDFFISYRREEYARESRLLYETLSSFEKSVYHDVERAPLGEFKKKLRQAYTHSNTILLLVSPTFFDRCSQEDDLIRKGLEHVLLRNENKSRDYQLIIPICFAPNFVWPENIPVSIAKVKDYQWIVLDSERMEDGVRQILEKEKEFWKDLRQRKSDALTIAEYSAYLNRQHKFRLSITILLILLTAFFTWFYWPEPLDIKKPVHSWEEAKELVVRSVNEKRFRKESKILNNLINRLSYHDNSSNTICDAISYGFSGIAAYLIKEQHGDFFSIDDLGYTPLMLACEINDLDLVKLLVECSEKKKNEYINYISFNNQTALSKALFWSNIDVAKYIIESGADIFKTVTIPGGVSNWSILMEAVSCNKPDAVQFLIKAAGERKLEYINMSASNNANALALALGVGNMEIAELLVQNGADIFKTVTIPGGVSNWSILMEAVSCNKPDAVQFLIKAAGERKLEYINMSASNNANALVLALGGGNMEIAEFLVQNGADIFNKEKSTGRTILMEFAQAGNLKAVQFLVEAAGEKKTEYINRSTLNDVNALVLALGARHMDVAQYLVLNGANIFQKRTTSNGDANFTILMEAAKGLHLDIVQFLVEAAGERKVEYVNMLSANNCSALSLSLNKKDNKVAKYLIQNGADVFKHYKLGESLFDLMLLSIVAGANQPEIIKLLLDAANDRKKEMIDHVDSDGCTALMYAVTTGALESIQTLIDERAELNLMNKEGKSALDLAKNEQIRKILLKAGAKSGLQLKKEKH